MNNTIDRFMLHDRVCVITGSAGLLGVQHAYALLDAGASVVLLDINETALDKVSRELFLFYGKERILTQPCNIVDKSSILLAKEKTLKQYNKIDVLINNASNNPKVENISGGKNWSRFEDFDINTWNFDIQVGLTGAFLCSQIFGAEMANSNGGVIINISSDLGIIAPDQRIYMQEGLVDAEQNVKPVTYSIIKHALIGLTKYLAIYWKDKFVRVNAICPGGIYNGQSDDFVDKLTNLIPMGRMANVDEYKAAIVFLASDASSYMTGSSLIIDGGRTCW
ncbi:MAG: SDR family oxidoreductase [Bacteroidales bacterium]|jgi:NAD(P)-dependent dehydrogenase (short-subunit alcohol dehydrogenase family)|nr:SDR family oxidoreductase [Bacteroidales bacterium]